jgi:hypothetical protein
MIGGVIVNVATPAATVASATTVIVAQAFRSAGDTLDTDTAIKRIVTALDALGLLDFSIPQEHERSRLTPEPNSYDRKKMDCRVKPGNDDLGGAALLTQVLYVG